MGEKSYDPKSKKVSATNASKGRSHTVAKGMCEDQCGKDSESLVSCLT